MDNIGQILSSVAITSKAPENPKPVYVDLATPTSNQAAPKKLSHTAPVARPNVIDRQNVPRFDGGDAIPSSQSKVGISSSTAIQVDSDSDSEEIVVYKPQLIQ